MFSNLSSSSISLATVTPSLVMRGAPNDLSSTTLRPFGPSVTRTAWARVSMPRSIRSRASTENLTSLADIWAFLPCGPRCPARRHAASGSHEAVNSGRRLRGVACFRDPRSGAGQTERLLGGLFLGHGLVEHAHDV